MHIEFREEMEKLRFEEEHILGKKPMQIDLLIIKMKTEEKSASNKIYIVTNRNDK